MKRVLLLIALTILPAAAQAQGSFGRFHALVIGNQNYQHLTKLKTPKADAEEVAKVLEEQYGFTVELLLDATWEQTMRAIANLRRTANREEDNLLIYYAGHGYLNEKTKVEYWQPVDAERDNDIYWMPTSTITNMLTELRARHALVVADSCYSGSLLMRDSGAELPDGSGLDELLRRMQERRSRTALTSGGEEPVLDGGGSGHSIFAKVFLEVLKTNQSYLDGYSLFELIRRPVALNAPQTPQYGDIRMTGHEWGDFLLVPKELQGVILQKQPGKIDLSYLQRGELPKQGDTMTDDATGMELVYIPGGCFMMGSPESEEGRDDDEGPVHEVCVNSFWMGKYEVTQGQWEKVMGSNPSYFKKGDDYPVEQVSWDDAQDFIKKLNSKSGKGYRLPTEAEWEYAARAGTSTARFWGDSPDAACRYANVYDQTSKKEKSYSWESHNCDDGYAETAPTGSFQPNSFGLHDMLGNVWEWCADWYEKGYYAVSPKDNPQGPESDSSRVIRGGGWFLTPGYVRAAERFKDSPDARSRNLGFRLVLPVQQAPAGM